MASKKKEELLQPEVQTQAQPAAQSTYSAEGLNSRADVEKAMANVSYRPGQQVTDAADALKQWQQNRPADYQSSYQDKINSLLGQLLERENFQYSYTRDPLYRQYEQLYTQNAHNASADAAAQAAALTGGYGSSYAASAARQAYQQQIDPNYIPKQSYEEQGILQEVQHQREYYPQPPYPEPQYPDWVNDCDDGMLPMEMGGM